MKHTNGIVGFVKDYINNQKVTNSKESYEDWLTKNGIDSDAIYDLDIKNARSDYAKAAAGFGALGEGLSSSGLLGSGYSDYINAAAYGKLQKARQNALSQYSENERANRSAYSEYVKKLAQESSSLLDRVSKDIIENGIADFDDAYTYAIGEGIAPAKASELAQNASSTVKKSIKEEIGRLIINEKLTAKEAKAYALYRGLGEEDAEDIYNLAAKINDYFTYPDGESYLDYITNNK